MRRLHIAMIAALVVCGCASAQTAADPGEGLRAAGTSGGASISWWGVAGRTYFLQTCDTMMEQDWRYVPVIESGAGAIITWNLSSSGERCFVRLRYTDQAYTGPVGEADFDGDGLTNAEEIAAALPPDARTDPFIPDTDGDGWNDLREAQQGSSGTNGILTPITQNPNYISLIRSFEVEKLRGSDSYSMARSKNSQGAWSDWSWGQYWNMPGDIGNGGGSDAVKPLTLLRGYPFTESQADTWWQFASGLYFEQFSPPLYISTQPSFYSYAQRGLDTYSADTYESENAWHGFEWHRYRIVLAETLPYEHREHFLVIAHRYEENPDYGVEGGVNPEYRWKRTDDIESVTSMTLTVPAGALEGGWQYQRPTTYESDTMIVLQVAQATMTLRANAPTAAYPDGRVPPNATAMFTPGPENGAYSGLMAAAAGEDRLGEIQMGFGRAETLGASYTGAVEVYANVPALPEGFTWEWERRVTSRQWLITLVTNPLTGRLGWKIQMDMNQQNQSNDKNDPIQPAHKTTVPSPTGRLYTGDGSALALAHFNQLPSGGYGYGKRQFIYRLYCRHEGLGVNLIAAEMPVAQVMRMQRNQTPITVVHPNLLFQGFVPRGNVNSRATIDPTVLTESEVRALVGGNTPIE